jgi:hypothetical protein
VDGVLVAERELRRMGNNRTKIGFNTADSGGDFADHGGRSFFEEIGALGGRRFREAVDFIRIDTYPGAFGPATPGFDFATAIASVLRHTRLCYIRAPGFPDSTPMHVTESGFGTGGERTPEEQARAIDQLIRTVHAYAACTTSAPTSSGACAMTRRPSATRTWPSAC